MAFLYSFMNLFQPGIVFPALAAIKPMMLISAIALAAGISSQSSYSRALVFKHPAFVYLSLFLLVQVLSMYRGGIGEMLNMFMYWYQFIIYMMIAVLLITNAEKLNRFLWGMVLAGQFIVFYGIYTAIAGLGTTVGGHAAGAYGMYENHNDYSYVIIMILPFIFMFWRDSESSFKKLILLGFLSACVIGMFLSLSRGGILALVFEGILLQRYVSAKNRKIWPLIVILAISGAGISYQWMKRDQFQGKNYTSETAKSSRIELWKAGKEMFKQHPFLGVGSRSFGEYAKEYYDLSYDQLGKNAHNTYVQIIATTGLFGIITFMAFVWKLIKNLRIRYELPQGNPLESIRAATLISFYTLLFRAFTNAKPHEWAFYMLCVIGVICIVLIKQSEDDSRKKTEISAEKSFQQ